MPGALGSVVTGFARRDKCWVSGCWLETLQATSLHCSSAVASPCCFQNRRAASLLGSLGGVVAGFVRRRRCWVRQARQLSGFLDVPPSALRAPPPGRCAHGARDFVVRLRRYWLRRRRYWARQVASILSLSSEVVRETLCKCWLAKGLVVFLFCSAMRARRVPPAGGTLIVRSRYNRAGPLRRR